jgi:tryptophan synthase beta chain
MNAPISTPDPTGHFGPYGGRFVPETLIFALDELTAEYARARADAAFEDELATTLRDFAGRPTPLIEAMRLSEAAGCRVFLKREDLLHTGAHKINNTIGQCLLTRRMNKPRVIAETGAGRPRPPRRASDSNAWSTWEARMSAVST